MSRSRIAQYSYTKEDFERQAFEVLYFSFNTWLESSPPSITACNLCMGLDEA